MQLRLPGDDRNLKLYRVKYGVFSNGSRESCSASSSDRITRLHVFVTNNRKYLHTYLEKSFRNQIKLLKKTQFKIPLYESVGNKAEAKTISARMFWTATTSANRFDTVHYRSPLRNVINLSSTASVFYRKRSIATTTNSLPT